jgi:hypothetical protein
LATDVTSAIPTFHRTSDAAGNEHPFDFTSSRETELLMRKDNRAELDRDERCFFKQEGLVTDTMGEANTSKELKRTQQEDE